MLFGFEWDLSSPLAFAISITPILLIGMWVTIQAATLGFAVALVLGLVWAVLKAAPSLFIAWPATVITEFIRDTPLLVQLFFLYYVLPEYGIVLPAFMTGALALGIDDRPDAVIPEHRGLDQPGFFVANAAIQIVLIGFVAFRLSQREGLPIEEKQNFDLGTSAAVSVVGDDDAVQLSDLIVKEPR